MKKDFFLFISATLLFTATKLFFVFASEKDRPLPVEPDDAMVYLMRNTIPENCQSMNCQAINSIKKQIYQKGSATKEDYHRSMQEASLLVKYTFAHTWSISFLHHLGYDWVSALKIFRFISIILTSLSIALLLLLLWGPIPSTIGLITLLFYSFNSQGIFIPVPSNMAMGTALFSWTLLLYYKRDHPLCYFFSILSILLHPFGKLLSLILCSTVSIYQYYIKKKNNVFWPLFFTSIVLATILIPMFIESPPLIFRFSDKLQNLSFLEKIFINLETITKGYSIKRILLFITPILLFAYHFHKNKKTIDLKLVLISNVIFFTTLSCLYYLPNYPGELFNRFILIYTFILSPLPFYLLIKKSNLLKKKPLLVMTLFISIPLIVCVQKYGHFLRHIELRKNRHNYSLPLQAISSFKSLSDCSLIFDNELPMFFSLSWGNVNCNYIYTPIQAEFDYKKEFNSKNYLFFGMNPISSITNTQNKDITIKSQGIENWQIEYSHNGVEFKKQFSSELTIPKHSKITKFYRHSSSHKHFPWGENVSLTINDKLLSFNFAEIIPDKVKPLFNERYNVVYSSGDYVLIGNY